MAFEASLSVDAQDHLRQMSAYDRNIVMDAIEDQLTHGPDVPTRRRKLMRENPLARWELRVRNFRVFYNVEGDQVLVIAVGRKSHNRLSIGGQEYEP